MNGGCPLCGKEIRKPKFVYRHVVCKKCWTGYVNRRQVAYIVDALLLMAIGAALGFVVGKLPFSAAIIGLFVVLAWLLRDTLPGQSPGKRLLGVIAIDPETGQPIQFSQAVKRNVPLALPAFVQFCAFCYLGFASLNGEPTVSDAQRAALILGIAHILAAVIVIVCAVQISKGPRWGDGWAHSRVILSRYANHWVFNPTIPVANDEAAAFAPALTEPVIETTDDPYRAPRA